ncbi:MAG: hypothetical protein WC291_07000 [Thermodesulfovibrionales bacterium]|jgi:hypothetical protein
MKKILSTILAAGMVLGLSGMAMAGDLATGTANVSAYVADYAAITGLGDITIDPFTGTAGEEQSGSDMFHVETNCAATITVSGTQLTQVEDTIATTFDVDNAGLSTPVAAKSNADHTVTVTGTLGAISGQASGNYSSTVTVTVSTI